MTKSVPRACQVLALAAAAVLAACKPPVPEIERSIVRAPAPSFTLPTADGKEIQSTNFQGQIVVLHFWATWSPASVRDILNLTRLQEEFGPQGVQVIGIALEESGTSDLRTFLQNTSINYTILAAQSDFHQTFGGIDAIPTTYLIDPDWHIVNRHTGLATYDMLRAEIQFMLLEKQQAAETAAAN